jgi:glucosamine--fructose-6-phosphate aminotransferase (isomerizing)
MCGIVGYVGSRPAQPYLIRALKKLEYRGYDSSGIAVLGDCISVYKDIGRVGELEKSAPTLRGSIGIGHTRWATHGEPSRINAHPHLDCTGRLAVIHNGVIFNYQSLKEELIREGHKFISDTDTEVIPHLIEKYYTHNLETAVAQTITRLKGSFAIAVIAGGETKMVVAKNGSPLVMGLGDHETIIASDVPPILDFTNRTIYLDDGEMGLITPDQVRIYKAGREISKPISVVDWNLEDVQKGGYDHFMLKEIHEQPKVIRDSLQGYSPRMPAIVGLDFMGSKDGKGLLILACGTSFHAGLVAKYVIEEILDIPVRVELASEVNHRKHIIPVANAIAISQSGETADVLISMKKLMEARCSTLAITNVRGSSASRLADQTLYTQAGPELSVAATKTFIAQLIELYKLILLQPSEDLQLKQRLFKELKQMPDQAQRVLDNESQIQECAKYIAAYSNIFYVGRGINYIHTEGYAAGELKHGPFSLLQKDTPVVAIVNQDFTHDAMLTNIKEIKSRQSPVIALVQEDDLDTEKLVDMTIKVPTTDNLLSPIVNTISLQLLAYYTAKFRNCPIDFPRNLAKSVTVE